MKNLDKITFPSGKQILGAWRRNARLAAGTHHRTARVAHGQEEECAQEGEHRGNCCKRHAVVLAGYGDQNFPFPTAQQLVSQVISYFNAMAREYEKHGKRLVIGSSDDEDDGQNDLTRNEFLEFVFRQLRVNASVGHRCSFLPQLRARALDLTPLPVPAAKIKRLVPEMDGVTMTPTPGPVLRIAAGTLAKSRHAGRYTATIQRLFFPFRGACHWAMHNMPEKYRKAATSLNAQLAKLEEIYGEALPNVIKFLEAQFPKAAHQELLDAAVSMLNEQLSEPLYVLSIWSDAFAQEQSGMYPEREIVRFLTEQAFYLFRTGDVTGACNGKDCQEKIKTHAYQVADVFMPRFSDQGPATIPGVRGPVGAHVIEIPFDERDLLCFYAGLYGHEWRHDCAADIEGLLDDMIEAVVKAIKRDYAAGKYKLSSETIMFGKQKVKLIDVITQIYAQTLGETDADIVGGVDLSGEGYGYCMLAVFGAFNLEGSDAFEADVLLRSGSYFAIGEKGELGFEPHMPDLIRLHILAGAYELIPGFEKEAAEFRRLADQAAGLVTPTHITWHNHDPKSHFKFDISISMADLKQMIPTVVNAIRHDALPSLGGLSNGQMVNWSRRRQDKQDALVRNLLAGKSAVPFEMGDFWAPYLAGATPKAVWALWKSGAMAPMKAVEFIEENSRPMGDQIKLHHAKRLAAIEAKAKAAPKTPAVPAAAESAATPAAPATVPGTGGEKPKA